MPPTPDTVASAYRGGLSLSDIAEIYGVRFVTVKALLKESGCPARVSGSGPRPDTAARRRIVGLLKENVYDANEIAHRIGRSAGFVRRFMVRWLAGKEVLAGDSV